MALIIFHHSFVAALRESMASRGAEIAFAAQRFVCYAWRMLRVDRKSVRFSVLYRSRPKSETHTLSLMLREVSAKRRGRKQSDVRGI